MLIVDTQAQHQWHGYCQVGIVWGYKADTTFLKMHSDEFTIFLKMHSDEFVTLLGGVPSH